MFLKNRLVYLSSPIECAQEQNIDKAKMYLMEHFGLQVFDPSADPKQQWKPLLDEARKNKDYELMKTIASKFVRKDLTMLDKSDFLIAYLPKNTKTTGTVHEIIVKNEQKKPVLLVCPEGKEFLSLWYFGFIRLEYMFDGWDSLYNYLHEVDQGHHQYNPRWSFVYGLI